MKSIEIKNVGPIEHLTIPVPEDGGLVVLRGRNGTGKSHALAAVTSLYNKEVRKGLRHSDRMPSGSIDGLGVTVKFSRSNTAKGELECDTLDSKLDLAKLIDPGIKDPVAADSKRLETIVHLANVKVDEKQWREALSPEIDSPQGQGLNLTTIVTDDPVVTSDRLRRACHDIALKIEKAAETQITEAKALHKSVEHHKFPPTIPENFALLEEFKILAKDAASAEEDRRAGQKAEADILKARAEFASVVDLSEKIHKAQGDQEFVKNELAKVSEQITELIRHKAALEVDLRHHNDTLRQLQEQARQFEQIKQIVEQPIPQYPTERDVEVLKELVNEKSKEISATEVLREAKKVKDKADRYAEQGAEGERIAERWRELARSMDKVLEDALVAAGFTDIKVHDGRLCVESDRGLEPFAELSHGERTKLAFDLAAKGLPKDAILVFGQEQYESLDPENREHVRELAQERGLLVFTAMATEGPLRAEVE